MPGLEVCDCRVVCFVAVPFRSCAIGRPGIRLGGLVNVEQLRFLLSHRFSACAALHQLGGRCRCLECGRHQLADQVSEVIQLDAGGSVRRVITAIGEDDRATIHRRVADLIHDAIEDDLGHSGGAGGMAADRRAHNRAEECARVGVPPDGVAAWAPFRKRRDGMSLGLGRVLDPKHRPSRIPDTRRDQQPDPGTPFGADESERRTFLARRSMCPRLNVGRRWKR